jgi:predicted nucleotidyltransferase
VDTLINKMDTTITTYLQEIELEHNIKIIYASDTGSRSKSMGSEHSDYDIKFIYIHNEYELNFDSNRKFLELPNFITIEKENSLFEFKGYVLDRAINFLINFNYELINIISSPNVYIKNSVLYSKFYTMLLKIYNQTSITYQLINMIKTHYKIDIVKKDMVSPKKYIHIIHSILKLNFVLNNKDETNVILYDFNDCLEYNIKNSFINDEVKTVIQNLYELKRTSNYDSITKIPVIDSEIEKILELKINKLKLKPATEIDSKEFYHLFIELLKMHF